MKKSHLYKTLSLSFSIALALQINAQSSFAYRAALDSITQTGFYQIQLDPSIAAKLRADFADIRILETGKQVPYILNSDPPVFKNSKFTGLPIVSNKKGSDNQTHVVVQNAEKKSLNELILIIKNAAADRMVTLSGSDNNQDWFVIRENISLNNFFAETSGEFIRSLSFPTSNYRYFRITMLGKNILPLNILQAGRYEETISNGRYTALPAPAFIQKDSVDKISYLFLSFSDHYLVDRIELQVSGARFYKRNLDIYSGSYTNERLPFHFAIQSETPSVFPIAVKTGSLLIKIYNDDNPPLHINAVKAFQLNNYLVTYLEKGRKYDLLFGDSSATAPAYDLNFFKDSISNIIRTIDCRDFKKNQPTAVTTIKTEKSNRWLIWIAIAAASSVLLLLTVRLTREINKRNT